MGWRRNFVQAINQATSDIIFLSDQDDIWDPEKVYSMVKAMNDTPSAIVLACNVNPFYQENDPSNDKKIRIRKYGSKYIEKVTFDRQWSITKRPGCAMCFRKEIIPLINGIWCDELSHDGCIWSIGVLMGKAYIVNENLVSFRRHCGNNTPSNIKTVDNRLNIIRVEKKKIERLLDFFSNRDMSVPKDYLALLQMQLQLMDERDKTLKCGKLNAIMKLISLSRYYPKISSIMADIRISLSNRSQ